jgi:hypothetical protein
MRFVVPWLCLAACSYQPGAASGDDDDDDTPPDSSTPDAYVLPDPEVLPGGGVGGGPIASGIHVYAFDENTDLPIANASVTIGSVTGTTDATGLFTTTDPSITGKQTILVSAQGYRPQLWVGVNGANVTIQLAPTAAPPFAAIAGDIPGFSNITVTPGHQKRGSVQYTQEDSAPQAVNEIRTAGNTNRCTVASNSTASCPYAIVTRTGPVALFATIVDFNPTTNTQALISFAYKTGLTPSQGTAVTGQDLTLIPPAELVDVTTNFGTPPAELVSLVGVFELSLPGEGNAILNVSLPSTPSKMPPLSRFPGASYRFLGLAQSQDQTALVAPLRSTTGNAIDVGTWLAPPSNIGGSHQQITFTPSTATIHTIAIADQTTSYLGVTILDDTTAVDIPITLPSGVLSVTVEGFKSTIDVTDFAFDTDRAKISDLAFRFGAL